MRIESITYPSPLEESDPENDNIDVNVQLDDGSVYSFLLATPNNIFRCMKNEGLDYFFSYPAPLLVKRLTSANIETALKALFKREREILVAPLWCSSNWNQSGVISGAKLGRA